MLNKQSAFDTAVKGILAQGKASMDAEGNCMYRGFYDTKCGVGHLIPDDKYSYRMEGKRAFHWMIMQAIGADPEDVDDEASFLLRLQEAHDGASRTKDFMASFKKQADELADFYGLDKGVLNA